MATNKRNMVEHQTNIQECVDYIMNERSGWSQFTSWYMEKYNTNRQQANRLWKEAWGVITEDFEDNIRQSVSETLLKLEALEEEARAEGDRRIWLDVIKYQAKIKGAEIERHQVNVQGNISIDVNFGE
jgi:hypothetical protein